MNDLEKLRSVLGEIGIRYELRHDPKHDEVILTLDEIQDHYVTNMEYEIYFRFSKDGKFILIDAS